MDPDLLFVGGLLVGALSVLSFLSALSDGRRPLVAALALLIGLAMVTVAVLRSPGTYSLATIPDAFYRAIATLVDLAG